MEWQSSYLQGKACSHLFGREVSLNSVRPLREYIGGDLKRIVLNLEESARFAERLWQGSEIVKGELELIEAWHGANIIGKGDKLNRDEKGRDKDGRYEHVYLIVGEAKLL